MGKSQRKETTTSEEFVSPVRSDVLTIKGMMSINFPYHKDTEMLLASREDQESQECILTLDYDDLQVRKIRPYARGPMLLGVSHRKKSDKNVYLFQMYFRNHEI